ncbi:unnamed protein product [Rotaria magnacalcarata]|uniref:Secretory protein n=2 Tax=Rotaria magnacalcarata TaxID=392030 RepID=A0A816F7A4_9BILA|nr:unnamed protein product [Rotaria magnacalcarata]CAF1655984.1 unnamed protein product [Rotaria magnacalcarata]CAF5096640.1 unnamed protein product [Rotaria magnacalcarata]CAF5189829.1 unnamed protein product [Rotaria magnacalcarata]
MTILKVILIAIAAMLGFSSADIVVYTSAGYKLTLVNDDINFQQDTRQRCIDTFFATMPAMCNRFNNAACSRDVRVTIDPKYDAVAYASGNAVVISANWLRNNPQDTDVMTHECMHIVQSYPGGAPGWLVEGIADYARWKFGRNNLAANWRLPDFDRNQHYTNAYRVTARFLAWCEQRYPNIVNQLDGALRSKTYTNNSWNLFSGGRSVDQLWLDYSINPNI